MTTSRKLVAGNWKMNLLREEALALTAEIKGMMTTDVSSACQIILFPPFVHLTSIVQLCSDNTRIAVGAQDCSEFSVGAYTGQVSAEMIKSCGATHVLIGHSERRALCAESNEMVRMKIQQALKSGLTPVLCIGESLAQRENGLAFSTVNHQLEEGLFSLPATDVAKVIIAYEPVWAIGTGLSATPEQAQEMHAYIRGQIAKHIGDKAAEFSSILYGGSCTPENAPSLFSKPDIDGGLIGGASLKSRPFIDIVKAIG
ncbi:MAG: triose-phosphate isomerase [Bacteroidota bacterium]|jgi:triosephosphate isomerase